MVQFFRHGLICVLFSLVAGSILVRKVAVTPIAKVINLLSDLKAEIEADGAAEATTYDKFACWCSETTAAKHTSINAGNDNIEEAASLIEEKSASRARKQKDLIKKKITVEETTVGLANKKTICAAEKAKYEASEADLSKAISSSQHALETIQASMSFLEINKSVQPVLELADAMGMLPAKKPKEVTALLQQNGKQDPWANKQDYDFKSNPVIEVLEDLKKGFTAQKIELVKEWEKTNNECESMKTALKDLIKQTGDEIDGLNGDITTLGIEIASHRKELIEYQGLLKDDEKYLTDLTKKCEEKAAEWDQRTSMRKGELDALNSALEILDGSVKTADSSVNKRAFIQNPTKKQVAQKHGEVGEEGKKEEGYQPLNLASDTEDVVKRGEAANFLQLSRRTLERSSGELSTQARQEMAVEILRKAGERLGKPMLSTLAMKVAEEPFKKVKRLIEQLIERLLAEAAGEAAKKGFCDTNVGKATEERNHRFRDTKKLAADLGKLQAKKDALESEIEELKQDIQDLVDTLNTTTTNRVDERNENLKTLEEAREGFTATKEALAILKNFYRVSARARDVVLLQASPIEEDNPGAGFGAGAYKGKQEGSVAIISLVTQIMEDFERTIRQTEAAEAQAHADFVEFDRTSKSDIAAREKKVELDEQDLATTKINMEAVAADLTTAQERLDAALQELEQLKPMCVDTQMAYQQRVAKREEEIKALEDALCHLDPDKTEDKCKD